MHDAGADGRDHGRPGCAVRTQGLQRYDNQVFNQGVGAEMIAERWKLSRSQLDEFAVRSHEKAAAAQDDGRFDAHIVPVPVTGEDGSTTTSRWTRAFGAGGSVEALAGLKPAFKQDGVIHAGNSSQISDGAAALLVTTSEKARELGLRRWCGSTAVSSVGDDPVIMLTAPIPATKKVLTRSGLRLDEIGAFEVNEAFASVPLAWLGDIGADEKLLNPNGGAIALGHPLGGSGARIMTTARRSHGRDRHPLRSADDVRGRRHGQRHHHGAARLSDLFGLAPLSRRRAPSWRGGGFRFSGRMPMEPRRAALVEFSTLWTTPGDKSQAVKLPRSSCGRTRFRHSGWRGLGRSTARPNPMRMFQPPRCCMPSTPPLEK